METPYGTASGAWELKDGTLTVKVTVPVGTTCDVTLPDGKTQTFGSGVYSVTASCQ